MHSRLWKLFPAAVALLLLLAVGAPDGPARGARAEDNRPAPVEKPLLGWSTWSFIRRNPSEANVEATAQAMHDSGLQAHGFQFVNLDDFYYVCPSNDGPAVDQFGRWVVDTAKFPNGMKAVGDHIHSLGLKFGMYVTPGISNQAVVNNTAIEGTSLHAADIATTATEKNFNCRHMVGIDFSKPGAQEFIDSWARLFASYGVDYIKLDGVGSFDVADVQAWRRGLDRSGRQVHLELSNNLDPRNGAVWRQVSGGWRISGDIECTSGCKGLPPGAPQPTPNSSVPLTDWSHVSSRFGQAAQWTHFGGAGHFNDLDALEVGNGLDTGLTPAQRQTMMTLWTLAATHFILGTDLTHLDPADLAMLTNDEVLAVEQAGLPGAPLTYNTSTQVWRSRQADGSFVVGLFNTAAPNFTAPAPPVNVHVSWADLGIQGGASVRDLWSHTDLGRMPAGFDAMLDASASRLIRVRPASPTVQVVADAPSVSRTGTTNLVCPACTDGVSVGLGGTLAFRDVRAPREGTSTLTIAYVNGGAASAPVDVSVNGRRHRMMLPPTGGGMGSMDAIGTVRLGVNLEERENRVTVTMGPGTLVALDSITVQHGAPA